MRVWVVRLAALLTMLAGSARAEIPLEAISPKLSLAASLRTRGEVWNFFEPGGTTNDDYIFGATLTRLSLAWKDDAFDVVVEGQSSALFALPDDAVGPPPIGALGHGGIYFANNRAQNDASVFLKQGFVNLKRLGIPGLSVKGGRFEFSEGSEVLTGDPTLDWLKNLRLSQRLIGPFSFAHVGRAFDGAVVSFTRAPLNVTAMASHPTQGLFDLDGMDEMTDVDLAYGAVNLTRPSFASLGDGRFFYIYYADDRGLLKSDNRAPDVRALDREKIEAHTFGAHWIHMVPSSAGPLDFLAWGALQTGDWGTLDHSGWAYAAETGWQPANVGWKPWLRFGYGRTSGDDDPADGDHDTFFQILPTARIYSFTTFYNLLNNADAFAQLLLRPMPGLVSRTDFHDIRLTEGRDLWYQGGGAWVSERDVGFGYAGRPAGGRTDLLRVLETTLSYDLSPNVSIVLYYAHVFGGAIVRSMFAGDQGDFGYVEMTLKI
ncbi:MAG: alginate export family protein [Deltaproteobacteria bacterium]|nr:alginate export family protein [Deltaproteobacteria bacterium]